MCHGYKLDSLNWCCQLLARFNGELNLLMKNVYCVSTKQHGDMKSGVLRSKNATILQARFASALSCSNT